jgi:hypothetical protein
MTAGMEPTVEIGRSKSARVLPMNAPSAPAAHHIVAPFLRHSVIPSVSGSERRRRKGTRVMKHRPTKQGSADGDQSHD